jgi:serine/threonine protein kinase
VILRGGISFVMDDIKYLKNRCFVCGTPGFIAPECFNGKNYSSKSDIFSFGVIMFCLLSGKNLFASSQQ